VCRSRQGGSLVGGPVGGRPTSESEGLRRARQQGGARGRRRQAARPVVKTGAIWRTKTKTGSGDVALLRSADAVNRWRQNASKIPWIYRQYGSPRRHRHTCRNWRAWVRAGSGVRAHFIWRVPAKPRGYRQSPKGRISSVPFI
jgi:hypothetical protein